MFFVYKPEEVKVPIWNKEILEKAEFIRSQREMFPEENDENQAIYLPPLFDSMTEEILEFYQKRQSHRLRDELVEIKLGNFWPLTPSDHQWLVLLVHFLGDYEYLHILHRFSQTEILPSTDLEEKPFLSFDLVLEYYSKTPWSLIPSELTNNQEFQREWLKGTQEEQTSLIKFDPFFCLNSRIGRRHRADRFHPLKGYSSLAAKFIWSCLWFQKDEELEKSLIMLLRGTKFGLPRNCLEQMSEPTKIFSRNYHHPEPVDPGRRVYRSRNYSRIVYSDGSELELTPWMWKRGLNQITFASEEGEKKIMIQVLNSRIEFRNHEFFSYESPSDNLKITQKDIKMRYEQNTLIYHLRNGSFDLRGEKVKICFWSGGEKSFDGWYDQEPIPLRMVVTKEGVYVSGWGEFDHRLKGFFCSNTINYFHSIIKTRSVDSSFFIKLFNTLLSNSQVIRFLIQKSLIAVGSFSCKTFKIRLVDPSPVRNKKVKFRGVLDHVIHSFPEGYEPDFMKN